MDELRQEVLDSLDKEHKFHRNTGWVQTKCPLCDHNTKKMHFNIKLVDGEPIIYKCFRASCGVAGMLNRYMGRKLGFRSKLNNKLENEAVRYSKYSTSHKYYSKDQHYDLGKLSLPAIEYFHSRTGKDLEYYQEELRVSSSMTDFIKNNMINNKKVYPLLKWEKEGANFLYFFNDAFSAIHYREIYGQERKGRLHIKEKGTGEILSHKPYLLQKEGKSLSDVYDVLVLAEGPFDIINTFFYIVPNIKATLISVAGLANMKSVILGYTKYHYKPKVFIVSDSDVTPSWYRYYLLKHIDDRVSELVLFYNRQGKDVGDIIDGIDLEKVVIKSFDKLEEENDKEKISSP